MEIEFFSLCGQILPGVSYLINASFKQSIGFSADIFYVFVDIQQKKKKDI